MPGPAEDSALGLFIDLHAHTTASDGTLTPAELVSLAQMQGLNALGITDHDTFAGFDEALPVARDSNFDLVCGIELNSRLRSSHRKERRSVHMLGYWPVNLPSSEFREWLESERLDRRNRNRQLTENLQARGVDLTLAEVEARGRALAGRPHFARLLIEKGYARNHEDAFRRFLGESAPTYVERQSHSTEDVIGMIRWGGGIPVIAHPVRLALDRQVEHEVCVALKEAGLLGLEVYHSEHPPELQAHYRQLAEELGLLATGGSDFHGAAKPTVELGTGVNGTLRVPREFLERMRRTVQ